MANGRGRFGHSACQGCRPLPFVVILRLAQLCVALTGIGASQRQFRQANNTKNRITKIGHHARPERASATAPCAQGRTSTRRPAGH